MFSQAIFQKEAFFAPFVQIRKRKREEEEEDQEQFWWNWELQECGFCGAADVLHEFAFCKINLLF